MATNKGFSLIEMLIYIVLLTVIFLLIINTMLSFTSSYREIGALRAADHAGIDAMERMTREIRDAASVDSANSSFNTSSGYLTLTKSGTTTKFYVQNNYLQMDINGSYLGPLTGSSTAVTSLIFNLISTTTSSAVKIDLTVQGISGTVIKTKQFHSTIVLRGQ
jgi:prepilin-type N-terminal cleavage/methylation domain-containing protein